MPRIILLGTLDTKLKETLYLRSQISEAFQQCNSSLNKIVLIDCGRKPSPDNADIDITQQDLVRQYAPRDGRAEALSSLSRSEALKFMTECATNCVKSLWDAGEKSKDGSGPHGILGAGGSGGTSLLAAVMRQAVPIGFPKLIASTVASGDTGPIVGETDITMMYSVVDIAGENELLRKILGNAAGAIVGMATAYERRQGRLEKLADTKVSKTRVGVTMFGVTTPCVDMIREHLESQYSVEVFVFHATGHGGRAMERLIEEEEQLDAVLDITTTEICDYLMGGSMSAGGERLEAALKSGVPNVISLGATDMVNFGPRTTVPERYKDRQLLEHNSVVTLMRTTKEECQQIGRFIVEKILEHAKRPDRVEIRLPKGGVSMIAVRGGPFEDIDADAELRETIKQGLEGSQVRVYEDDRDINDKGFAIDAAKSLMRMIDGEHK